MAQMCATKFEYNDIVCGTVLRDMYDCKQDWKELHMFSIGGDIITDNNKWVGYMSHTNLGNKILFYPKCTANDWLIMEK